MVLWDMMVLQFSSQITIMVQGLLGLTTMVMGVGDFEVHNMGILHVMAELNPLGTSRIMGIEPLGLETLKQGHTSFQSVRFVLK